MSRMLRSPSLRASTGLLGLGVLLWLLLRAPVSSPHHTIQAHAPFEILASHLQEPSGLARDPDSGDLFVAEADTGVILRIDPEGRISTFATGFRRPVGLAWDARDGSLLVVAERGYSSRRTEFQAALGCELLTVWRQLQEARSAAAKRYDELIDWQCPLNVRVIKSRSRRARCRTGSATFCG